MPEELKEWTAAIAKLIELTQQGKVKWTPIVAKVSGLVGPALEANYRNRRLRLTKVWESVSGLDSFISEKAKVMHLDFVDDSGTVLWSFPENDALDDLYQAAKFQAAGVQDFLTDILKD
jgi:hypothetical protein